MSSKRFTVLGLGLLGGSFCQAIRSLPDGHTVIGYAHRSSTLLRAKELGIATGYADTLEEAVKDADVVVICSPIGTFETVIKGIAPHLKPGAIVTDVGSTKRTICRLAREHLPESVHFVGSHPMAGGERSGAVHARSDLFHNAAVIVTPESDSNPDAVAYISQLWKALGSRVTHVAPEMHDRLVASISHLPHAAASMLVTLQSPSALELSGGGYRDTTRIAAGDPDLWRDILIDNRDYVANALRLLRDETTALIDLLDKNNPEAVREYLAAAAIKRGTPIRERSQMV